MEQARPERGEQIHRDSPSKLGVLAGSNSFLHVLLRMTKTLTVNLYVFIDNNWKMIGFSIADI